MLLREVQQLYAKSKLDLTRCGSLGTFPGLLQVTKTPSREEERKRERERDESYGEFVWKKPVSMY